MVGGGLINDHSTCWCSVLKSASLTSVKLFVLSEVVGCQKQYADCISRDTVCNVCLVPPFITHYVKQDKNNKTSQTNTVLIIELQHNL